MFVSADVPTPKSAAWLSMQWKLAQQHGPCTLLVIDEIQKVDFIREVDRRII
jgi:hypothetical protein